MIADEWKGAAVGSLLGPGHGPLMPSVFYGVWLDTDLEVVAATGLEVSHDAFEVVGDSVVNTATVDAGLYPDTDPVFFGIAAEVDGTSLFAYGAPAGFEDSDGDPVTPVEGDSITFDPGSLTLVYVSS